MTCRLPALCLLPLLLSTTPPASQAQAPPPVAAPLPSVSIDYSQISGSLSDVQAQNVRLLYGGELSLRADTLQGDLLGGQFDALGHVQAHEADTDLLAASLRLNSAAGVGTARRALLTQAPYTIRAGQIDVTAGSIVAHAVAATTAPPNVRPDLEVRAQTISLYPGRHHGEMRNASLYLLRARVLTLPRVGFTIGANAGTANRQGVVPTAGVSARYGTYVAFGGNIGLAGPSPLHYRLILPSRQQAQVRVTSRQTLYQQGAPSAPAAAGPIPLQPNFLGGLRALATLRRPPLPPGDPLLFHDLLPEPNPIYLFDGPARAQLGAEEELSTHLESLGRRRDDLYVSRLPEVTLSGTLPLSPAPPPRTGESADAFRHELRQARFVAFGQTGYGVLWEQRLAGSPGSVRESRQQNSVGLTMQPLLVAPNTVILPQIRFTTNSYSGQHSAYKYVQFTLAANHYFSPRSAVGLLYAQSGQSGDSPFDFDHLDTSRELDLRAQMGSRRLTLAGLVRYDLAQGGVIDYKLAVAPGLAGITPVFSYNFRNRSLGVGVQIEGLTF